MNLFISLIFSARIFLTNQNKDIRNHIYTHKNKNHCFFDILNKNKENLFLEKNID